MSDQLVVTVQRPTLTIAVGAVPVAAGGSLTDGDKGDIVVSASGTLWAIDPSVLSAFGRTLIDDADAATARATLGLGTGALDARWTNVVLGSDFVESSGSLTDVGLAFTPAASKIYEVEANLVFVTAATTTGLQWCFTAADLGTGTTWAAMAIMVPSSINAQVLRFAQLGVVVAGTSVTSTAFDYLATGRCLLKTGTAPSGDLKVQAQTEVAASAVTIKAGSFIRYREVA